MKKITIFLFSAMLVFFSACNQPKEDLNIEFEKYTLSNGLDVILHIDRSDPIVAFAVQYHVGSNREEMGRTGFAHLFEHMMFQRSENVGEDQFFSLIQNAGGTLNGGTGNDATTYYEVVPKNALEMVLWMESDRMGYLENTVTQKAFAIQQNVVQNEKRQTSDNRPYGYTQWVVAKNLYPEGHPYNHTVIGEMEDLFNATVNDVKAFHRKFYNPNNATIVIAGDFDEAETKAWVEKYFGEIPAGESVSDPDPIPVQLAATKKVYHEDNFARAAQLRMIWPTVEQFSDESYALDYLSALLSQGKKAPLYRVLEKEKGLTSSQYASNRSQEITGTFSINVTANSGKSLKEVEEGVFEAFDLFEKEGFTNEDVERIKAGLETGFYNSISSVLGKSFQLATYSEYAGDPSYYKTDISKMKAVTKEDILAVYDKYIKGKTYLATSFVPKGQVDLVAEGSVSANVVEENILNATQVAIDDSQDEEIVKTKTSFDRSVQPTNGPDPMLNLPTVWTDALANGMKVYGIEQNELPLIQFNIVLKGGHFLDGMDKSGTANLLASLMMEGTQNKTPQELEEAIDALGASIRIRSGSDDITISVNTLARNFMPTLSLVEEILLQPRWDEEEFTLAKSAVQNQLNRQKANPGSLAQTTFMELIYGKNHIYALDRSGTAESVASITMDDLKAYYQTNFSPSVASFLIAGDIGQEKVISALADLNQKWEAKEVAFPEYELPAPLEKSQIYFIDVPGAKQSIINIGNLSLSNLDEEFFPATVMNYKLGGSFSGVVNLVLREEKGYTYGARTGFSGGSIEGPFMASSSVRSTATAESVEIFKDLMTSYRDGISEDDLQFTKNSLIKSNAREFETLGALIRVLNNMDAYNLPADYIRQEENIVRTMTLDEHRRLAQELIHPEKMYYVIAGDAATQMEPLKAIGFGDPILVK
ncbi:MAG: insulinase family protein [Bacteroidales bacterium]|nr:insulinase family protein [Bacteroidales bacterium]